MNGIEASLILSQLYPSIKIIAFSQYDIEANIIEMNVRGVMSFIGKEDEPEVLLKAIRVVNDGGVYMTAKSAEIVQNYLRSFSKKNKLSSDLSPTEIVILRAICKGQSSTDIGKLVNKSHRTVEKYRNELYQKLNVADKKQLISLVSEWSILK